jgi:predicted LPLAT superfamily acyltransferase
MDEEEQALLFSVVESGQGCLLVGSHFGNLEYSRGIAHRHPDLVINILIYDQHAANFATLLTKSAPESRLNLIQVTELDLDRALQLKERVDAGEWLLIAGDRVPVGESDNVWRQIQARLRAICRGSPAIARQSRTNIR